MLLVRLQNYEISVHISYFLKSLSSTWHTNSKDESKTMNFQSVSLD